MMSDLNISCVQRPCFAAYAVLWTVDAPRWLQCVLRSIHQILQYHAHLAVIGSVFEAERRDLVAQALQGLRSTHAHARQRVRFLGDSDLREPLLQVPRVALESILYTRNAPAIEHVDQHVNEAVEVVAPARALDVELVVAREVEVALEKGNVFLLQMGA